MKGKQLAEECTRASLHYLLTLNLPPHYFHKNLFSLLTLQKFATAFKPINKVLMMISRFNEKAEKLICPNCVVYQGEVISDQLLKVCQQKAVELNTYTSRATITFTAKRLLFHRLKSHKPFGP